MNFFGNKPKSIKIFYEKIKQCMDVCVCVLISRIVKFGDLHTTRCAVDNMVL